MVKETVKNEDNDIPVSHEEDEAWAELIERKHRSGVFEEEQ